VLRHCPMTSLSELVKQELKSKDISEST
jgi:hypothetical protein